jgi:hypothetical protein
MKHYLKDDHIRQRLQLTIYPDGSMTFLYQNLLPELLDLADSSGYPVVIGAQEGFTKPDNVDDSKWQAGRQAGISHKIGI